MVLTLCMFSVIALRPQAESSQRTTKNHTNFNVNDFYKVQLEDTIPVPCIEPHCTIECNVLYPVSSSNQVLATEPMTLQQKEHLAIDLGEDELVNRLISEEPRPKICPYRTAKDHILIDKEKTQVDYYPLSFGFNEHFLLKTIPRKIVINGQSGVVMQTCIPKKTIDFSELVPGKRETYSFEFAHELDYRRLYSASYFAVTMKKGGWDCNRHYEIISCGTMPYFDSLEKSDNLTMKHLPKSLLNEAKSISGINRNNLTLNHSQFNFTQYQLLLHRLIYYSRHRLTTRKLVEYILRTVNYKYHNSSEKHSILYISHNHCDYMKEFMLHGFTLIFEEQVHVYDPPAYLYGYSPNRMWTPTETANYYGEELYGFGYGFALSLRKYAHLYIRDISELSTEYIVMSNIQRRQYSLIVFGSIIRRNNLLSHAAKYYKKSEMILIDGEDERKESRRSEFAKLGTYFLREIPDDCDRIS